MSEKIKAMQTPKRASIGGHMVTVFLTDYDEGSDSYFGEAHRNRSMEVGEKPPVVESVAGLRPYPYTSRPDYAFQFVECGQDEQPLIDIASRNAQGHDPRNQQDPNFSGNTEVQDNEAVPREMHGKKKKRDK